MRRIIVILLGCFLTMGAKVQAVNDTTRVARDTISFSMSNHKTAKKSPADSTQTTLYKPDPSRAIWLGCIVPGLGQVYNHKYWKLPLLYGGFAGLAYAISWNNRMYNDYKNAYLDITGNNPNATSYLNLLTPYQRTQPIDKTWLTSAILTQVEVFRRYRDLSVICAVGLYALSIIDAYVDAQLYDFDVSPDLSMKIAPTLLQNQTQPGFNASLGMKLQFKF